MSVFLEIIREIGGGLAAAVIVAQTVANVWLIHQWRQAMQACISDQKESSETIRDIQRESIMAMQTMTSAVEHLRNEFDK